MMTPSTRQYDGTLPAAGFQVVAVIVGSICSARAVLRPAAPASLAALSAMLNPCPTPSAAQSLGPGNSARA
jgi:hypothetical protein